MKFVLPSSQLLARLTTVGRVIVQKNNLPILDCFCFDIKGEELTITASDNDTTITSTIKLLECDADVRFAVNAKTMQDAIKEIPEQPLECYLNTDTLELTIDYQNGQYKLMAQDATEYPVPATTEEQRIDLTISSQHLLSGVSRSIIAAANDVLRPQLNAVCFDLKDHKLSMVASNGNHLALTQVPMGTIEEEGTFLMGSRPAGLLKAILGKGEGDTVLSFGARSAIAKTAEYTLTCRLVEGRYPNYRSVIPQNNPNVITLNRIGLVNLLRRVRIMANPQAMLVKFILDGSTLKITSQDADFGCSAEETMLCDYSGMPMRIAFKGSTLLDLIQNIDGEEIVMKLSDPSRAGIILPAKQEEEEEVLMLIMPSVFTD